MRPLPHVMLMQDAVVDAAAVLLVRGRAAAAGRAAVAGRFLVRRRLPTLASQALAVGTSSSEHRSICVACGIHYFWHSGNR